jgi:hypothetical protein
MRFSFFACYFLHAGFLLGLLFNPDDGGYVSRLSVGRSNCCWSSPAQSFLASGLVEIYDQGFCSLQKLYVFRSGAYLWRGEGSVFMCRRYVCCTSIECYIAAGLCQHSDSWFRVTGVSWPYSTVWRLWEPSRLDFQRTTRRYIVGKRTVCIAIFGTILYTVCLLNMYIYLRIFSCYDNE